MSRSKQIGAGVACHRRKELTMAKKTQNNQTITGMRKALAQAHNDGNPKAINRDMANGAGADSTVFTEWVDMVERRLYDVVADYVQAKKNSRWDSTITEAKLDALRSQVYPVWKEILAAGEEWKTKTKLRVTPHHVEDLVGFAWKFVRTGRGTAEAPEGKQVFRKKVESLIGCEMAKSQFLTEEEDKDIREFYGAQKAIDKYKDLIDEKKQEKKGWILLKKDDTSADFAEHISNHIRLIDAEIKELEKARGEAEATEMRLRSTVLGIETRKVNKIKM